MSIDSVMPSNHLIHCGPLLLLPSIFPSIGVFSSESVLCIRWSKYWSFNDYWRNYCLITYCWIIIKKRLLLNLCNSWARTSGAQFWSWPFSLFLFWCSSLRQIICLMVSGYKPPFKVFARRSCPRDTVVMTVINRIIPSIWSTLQTLPCSAKKKSRAILLSRTVLAREP